MAKTSVITVRIDPDLLAALKDRAATEGRSVSAEVIRMIRSGLEPAPRRRGPRTRTMGMFADHEAPNLADFKRLRRGFSASVRTRIRRRGRAA